MSEITREALHELRFDTNENGNPFLDISIQFEVIRFDEGSVRLSYHYEINGARTVGCPGLFTIDELLSLLRMDKMISSGNVYREWSHEATKRSAAQMAKDISTEGTSNE